MKCLLLTLLVVLAIALGTALPSGSFAAVDRSHRLLLPHWLKAAETQTLDRVFGGATPIHTYYISYPRKIAVIFEFKRVVICRTCSSPTRSTQPRGRLIRISYDRQTHKFLNEDGIRFCESKGSFPARALCLHR